MNILIILSIAILIYAYAKLYLKPKTDVELLQSNLENFDPNLLFEKQPIILYDKIVNPKNVIDVFFKYTHNLSHDSIVSPSIEKQNLSKFLIIHNTDDNDQMITLTKYLTKIENTERNMFFSTVKSQVRNENMFKIVLPAKNLVIVPYLYTVKSSIELPAVFLTDLIHVYV